MRAIGCGFWPPISAGRSKGRPAAHSPHAGKVARHRPALPKKRPLSRPCIMPAGAAPIRSQTLRHTIGSKHAELAVESTNKPRSDFSGRPTRMNGDGPTIRRRRRASAPRAEDRTRSPRDLELGAGTGKFTQGSASPPARTSSRVEPVDAMRGKLSANCCPGISIVDGTAEAIPLRRRARVDAVVAAQAFHWFRARRSGCRDPPRAQSRRRTWSALECRVMSPQRWVRD